MVRKRNRNNPTIDEAIGRYLRLAVVVVALLVGTGTAGYGYVVGDSAIVVAAVTLAIGVAGQTVIGSIVSGVVLVVDPEFNVGDFIRWEDGEGAVQSITLRVTRVLTPGGELVTVPNTVLTDGAVTRPFGGRRYRIVDRIGLSYESDVDSTIELIEGTARTLDEIDLAPSPRAYVDELGPDSVWVEVHYWVDRPNRTDVPAVKSAFARALKRKLAVADVEIDTATEVELQGRVTIDSDADSGDSRR